MAAMLARVQSRGCRLLDRGVLGGQAERIPAHRVQNVVILHPAKPSQRVADRVVADVPHVDAAEG